VAVGCVANVSDEHFAYVFWVEICCCFSRSRGYELLTELYTFSPYTEDGDRKFLRNFGNTPLLCGVKALADNSNNIGNVLRKVFYLKLNM
jgi:hypothetical protein